MKKISCALFILSLLGSVVEAQATSFMERSFPDTVADAPIMIRGTIGMSYSDWGASADKSRRIYTFYELVPGEVLKGSVPGGNLIVREVGGTKDGKSMDIPGTARFGRGEEVVLTLSARNEDGSYDMRGMMMGKFNLRRGEDGKDYLTGPGLISPEEARDHEVVHPGESGKAVYSLEDLRELIRNPPASGVSLGAAKAAVPSPSTVSSPGAPSDGASPAASNSSGETPAAESGQSSDSESGSTRRLIVGAIILALLIVRRFARAKRKP